MTIHTIVYTITVTIIIIMDIITEKHISSFMLSVTCVHLPLFPWPELEYRLDFQLREQRMENSYLAVLTSHTGYWTNKDVAFFLLTHLHPELQDESCMEQSGADQWKYNLRTFVGFWGPWILIIYILREMVL